MSFFIRFGRSQPEPDRLQKLRRVQEIAMLRAAMAARQLGPAAQRAGEMAGGRMHVARQWTAPQLERAAQYVEDSIAPRVSAMLASTAQRIEPPRPPSHRLRNTMLGALAVVGAVGVVGALFARYRILNGSYIEEYIEVDETEPRSASAGPSAKPGSGMSGSGMSGPGMGSASASPSAVPGMHGNSGSSSGSMPGSSGTPGAAPGRHGDPADRDGQMRSHP